MFIFFAERWHWDRAQVERLTLLDVRMYILRANRNDEQLRRESGR